MGYRLLPEWWGKGLATEGARVLIRYEFEQCDLEKIVGFTHIENESSQNVLLKCGLARKGTIPNPFSKEEPAPLVRFFRF